MLIGYARVSTIDQDLALQTEALTRAGCEKMFADKASGVKTDRPGLTEALQFLRAGDTPVIWKLDRHGRSIRGLIELAADLSDRKIDFRSLTDGFDTATPSRAAALSHPCVRCRKWNASWSGSVRSLDWQQPGRRAAPVDAVSQL